MASEKLFRLLIIDFEIFVIWWFELVQCKCGIGTVLFQFWLCMRAQLCCSSSSWIQEDYGLGVIEIASFLCMRLPVSMAVWNLVPHFC